MIVKAGKIYFSLREIAPTSPYSADYLRIRICQKKLKGIKIGREWYTSEEWLADYVSRYGVKVSRDAERKFPIRYIPEKQFVPLPSVVPVERQEVGLPAISSALPQAPEPPAGVFPPLRKPFMIFRRRACRMLLCRSREKNIRRRKKFRNVRFWI